MNVDKKELKEQEIRSLFISPALNAKGWNVSRIYGKNYFLYHDATTLQWLKQRRCPAIR